MQEISNRKGREKKEKETPTEMLITTVSIEAGTANTVKGMYARALQGSQPMSK